MTSAKRQKVKRKKKVETDIVSLRRHQRKEIFITQLAIYLAENQAGKSIAVQVEAAQNPPPVIPWARQWAFLRGTTSLFGYPTVEEAEAQLREFLK